MKWKFWKSRYTQLGMLFFFLFLILTVRLLVLQLVNGAYYRRLSDDLINREVPLKARRGAIYDRRGEVLAWNRPSFQVDIFQNELARADGNRSILTAVRILEKNGDTWVNNLPLIPSGQEGKLAFIWDMEPADGTVEDGPDHPADSNANLRVIEMAKRKWLEMHRLEETITADEAFDRLRERYDINASYTQEEALKILAVRNEIRAAGSQRYQPVPIALDISQESVAALEELRPEIPGVEVTTASMRYYPNGSLASHVLGYMGIITAEEWEANKDYYVKNGYNPATDLVGRWELEKVLEPYLHGKDGARRIQVNAAGRSIRVLENREPVPGYDVVLTLDARLQMAAEEALEQTMEKIRSGAIGSGYPNAYTGSVVVIDVKTGGILALANKPDYDPNAFAAGQIDPEIWKKYNPSFPDPRNPDRESSDPTLPRPMRNNAVRGIFPPGSVYKMVIAAAGLEEGVVAPYSIIVDKGRYTRYTTINPPACWIWNQSKGTHGAEDVISALRDSCNYYFYEVGNRLGIDRIEQYARWFGFGQPTGIELPGEVGGIVAGKAYTNQSLRLIVRYRIARLAGKSWQEAAEEEKRDWDAAAASFIENSSFRAIRDGLRQLGIHADDSVIDREIYSYIRDYRWNPGKTLSASIGQAENTFSPLQLANYTAALANGGTLWKTRLVERILSPDGQVVLQKQPEAVRKIDIKPENLDAIHKGMLAVTTRYYEGIPGSAARHFTGFPVKVAGKTGSAQFPGRDAYGWFVAFAPYENPEIAAAVMIAQAGSGSNTVPVVRAIFEEYFGRSNTDDVHIGRNTLQR
jgi:penicillin-binding protein 2